MPTQRLLFEFEPTTEGIARIREDAAFWKEELQVLTENGTEKSIAASLRLQRVLNMDDAFKQTACPACAHLWRQHKRTVNGAYACTYHGCGCRDVVPLESNKS